MHISHAAKIFMILKDESETGSNDLLVHRREGDVSLSSLISQEHCSYLFRSEGKDLLSLYPVFGGGNEEGLMFGYFGC